LIFIPLNAVGGSYSRQLSRVDTFSYADTPSSGTMAGRAKDASPIDAICISQLIDVVGEKERA